jgi:FkbM family methyltransferase
MLPSRSFAAALLHASGGRVVFKNPPLAVSVNGKGSAAEAKAELSVRASWRVPPRQVTSALAARYMRPPQAFLLGPCGSIPARHAQYAPDRSLVLTPLRSSLVTAIEAHLPKFTPAVVFDVGANVGQSALDFVEAFPHATIYAFEPVARTYEALLDQVREESRIRPFNLALGANSGTARMNRRGKSVTRRIVERAGFFQRRKLPKVAIEAGDRFCGEHGVDRISFLKVDTEGHDLKVLMGFQRMLSEMRIDLVEAEVGLYPGNTRHVPLESVKIYLEGFGYSLFHLYEFVMDKRHTGRPVMRRCNAVFASETLVEANRRPM